ncbi:recombinase family protein [Vagococcus fluvialis]|uniref:recombinase family protein n=1 Tax=Vagococcus fluvialis TaxID=2738 RepID=UPI003B21EC99
MRVGYARVSTMDQNLDRQLKELEGAGCEKVYHEKQSGKNTDDRVVFKECLTFLRQGDVLVVASLDRLGRNYEDITKVVGVLNDRGVSLSVLDMPFLNADIQDETMARLFKDMIINLLSYVAETERKKMLERQAQGIEIAKAKGVYKGKPLEYSPTAKDKQKRAIYFNIVDELKEGTPIMQIVKKYDVSRNLVYRIRKELSEGDA